METCVEVENLEDVARIHADWVWEKSKGIEPEHLTCEWYANDDRIKWDTWAVCYKGQILGFSNGQLTSPSNPLVKITRLGPPEEFAHGHGAHVEEIQIPTETKPLLDDGLVETWMTWKKHQMAYNLGIPPEELGISSAGLGGKTCFECGVVLHNAQHIEAPLYICSQCIQGYLDGTKDLKSKNWLQIMTMEDGWAIWTEHPYEK